MSSSRVAHAMNLHMDGEQSSQSRTNQRSNMGLHVCSKMHQLASVLNLPMYSGRSDYNRTFWENATSDFTYMFSVA